MKKFLLTFIISTLCIGLSVSTLAEEVDTSGGDVFEKTIKLFKKEDAKNVGKEMGKKYVQNTVDLKSGGGGSGSKKGQNNDKDDSQNNAPHDNEPDWDNMSPHEGEPDWDNE